MTIQNESLCPSCIHKNVCRYAASLLIISGEMIDDSPSKRVIKCDDYMPVKRTKEEAQALFKHLGVLSEDGEIVPPFDKIFRWKEDDEE